MELRTLTKYGGRGTHRTVSARATLARVWPLLPRVGVTRVADITGLDRVGIPTYSAIVPDSRDVLSVYNGKGSTRVAARVGAIMEAIERYSALEIERPIVRGSYRELSRQLPLLYPRRLVLGMSPRWTEEAPIDWVEGRELTADRAIWVPLQAVAILHEPPAERAVYRFSTTNGLAAGNELEEAICHALCELIERDAWTLAELEARYRPEAQRRRDAAQLGAPSAPSAWVDDVEAFPDVDTTHVGTRVARLLRRFSAAGLCVRVKDITSDLGIATFLAAVVEHEDSDAPLAHFGLGTHPDAEVALARALTEVAQSRAVDIQGVREDISAANASVPRFAAHTKRVERVRRTSWCYLHSSAVRPLSDVPTHRNATIDADIETMLARLRGAKIRHVVAVDLTRRDLGIPVVRVLAPGLESWAADHGRLGWRAAARWERWFGSAPAPLEPT
jgi:ribosomal protein S12 methylthiotransferase accessory factor